MPFNYAVYSARYTRLRDAAYFVPKLFAASYYFTYLNQAIWHASNNGLFAKSRERRWKNLIERFSILQREGTRGPPSKETVAFPRIP